MVIIALALRTIVGSMAIITVESTYGTSCPSPRTLTLTFEITRNRRTRRHDAPVFTHRNRVLTLNISIAIATCPTVFANTFSYRIVPLTFLARSIMPVRMFAKSTEPTFIAFRRRPKLKMRKEGDGSSGETVGGKAAFVVVGRVSVCLIL